MITITYNNSDGDFQIRITSQLPKIYFKYVYKMNWGEGEWEQISRTKFDTFEECWESLKENVNP